MSYVWLGCGLALLIVILFFPLRLRLQFAYSKNAGNKKRLSVWLGGILLANNDFNAEKKLIEDKLKGNKDALHFGGFMQKVRWYESVFNLIKDDLARICIYFKNKLVIPSFTLQLDLGFDDAAQTGIASGAAYGLVYSVAALIYNNLNLKKKDLDVQVTPHYDNPKLDFYFNGIFRLRVVHIIIVLFLTLQVYAKYKKILIKLKKAVGWYESSD